MSRSTGASRDSSDVARRCLASANVFAPANAADNNGGDSRPSATASDPWWYATGKNGVPAGTLAAAANRKLPMPPGVWRAIATIASPAAVTPAGDALRSGEATWTEKLTFLVVVTSSAAHAPNSDRKSTRLNSSYTVISYAVFC